MLLYRIVLSQYAHSLFAPGEFGRWNRQGEYVIYTSASAEIALLENMAHRMGQGGLVSSEFACMEIEAPDHSLLKISRSELPPGWGSASPYSQTNALGSAWYQKQEFLLLQVPSAPAPTGFNVVINTAHPLFKHVILRRSFPVELDHRFKQMDRDLSAYLKKRK